MHTEKLQKLLSGFELFILNYYDAEMEKERKEAEEYGTFIFLYDNEQDFYEWLDGVSWNVLKLWIEEYSQEVKSVK